MRIRNISPFGRLEVTAVGLYVDAGEEFDVDDAQAPALLAQAENFVAVTSTTSTATTSSQSASAAGTTDPAAVPAA